VTPQKKKLAEATDTKDSAESFKTGSKTGKKGENPSSVTGNTLSSSIKSASLPQMTRGRIQNVHQVILLRSPVVQGSGQGKGGRR